ncbi:hypothetical protein ABIC63_002925 [Pseudacidovorax sp. 1753]|uniref:alpha/beta hydrolase n=1 Tax=Pseudacidovorax sp. 1753 TaxID=3156419 RepID=UPI00339AC7D5
MVAPRNAPDAAVHSVQDRLIQAMNTPESKAAPINLRWCFGSRIPRSFAGCSNQAAAVGKNCKKNGNHLGRVTRFRLISGAIQHLLLQRLDSRLYFHLISMTDVEALLQNYGKAFLDKAYNQLNWATNAETVLGRFAACSQLARDRIGAPRICSYGDSAVENLELFQAKKGNAPIYIFIHGGAWREGDAHQYSFLAEAPMAMGAHVLIPNFANVLNTGGDLVPMVDQVAESIAWAYKNAASFGGDKTRIYVSGHSSGAHLALPR